jgi:hypothetical protein
MPLASIVAGTMATINQPFSVSSEEDHIDEAHCSLCSGYDLVSEKHPGPIFEWIPVNEPVCNACAMTFW